MAKYYPKELSNNDLENVSGGIIARNFTCKECGFKGEGHHWKAAYSYRTGRTVVTRTASFCDDCYLKLKNDQKYYNWTECNVYSNEE